MGYGMSIATGMLATSLLIVPGISESSTSPSNTVNMQPMAATQCKTGIKKYASCKLKERFPKSYKTQFGCLDKLWKKESGWRWWADNPYSDAYGIPQANPGKKMRSAGSDWKTNPRTQIRWGLKYIKGRYKTPCAALKFHRNNGWY